MSGRAEVNALHRLETDMKQTQLPLGHDLIPHGVDAMYKQAAGGRVPVNGAEQI